MNKLDRFEKIDRIVKAYSEKNKFRFIGFRLDHNTEELTIHSRDKHGQKIQTRYNLKEID
jgi:hypothetical protein